MKYYRKKPVVVEAWLVKDLNYLAQHSWDLMPVCIQEAYEKGGFIFGAWIGEERGIMIPTLEGEMFAGPDDWIIRDIQGEFYPCKPDIFEATYEEVEDPTCSNCNIPLRVIMNVSDGRCSDVEACDMRRSLLALHGHAHLISPEGVTRIEPTKED